MRRHLPPTNRNRSQSLSYVSYSSASSSKTNSPLMQYQAYGIRSTNSSPKHADGGGRRESLVKPTWQNIRPGQIPLKTLDKINGITNDSNNEGLEYLRRSSFNYGDTSTTATIAAAAAANHQQQTNARKHSGSYLEQLALKGSLFVHRHTLSAATSSSIDSTSVSASTSTNANGVKVKKSTGRSLVRMIKNKCATINGSDKEMFFDIMAKVIMLGDSGVGKTSFIIMFRDGVNLPCSYVTTVGIDFMNKVVMIDGTRVKLQIWDTAGQERFRSVTHAYYRDAHALLLLYDVTNKTTYDNIRAWLCEIRDCAQEDVVIVLIGNKSDCSSSERQVKREDGERLAREHNVPFMETSAKTGLNVELAFQTVARKLKNRDYDFDDGKFNVHEFERDNSKAKSMCGQCSF